MNDLIRVVPDNPVDEEFSVKECAVQKRTDSKKSNDDETSYTSGISDSTSEDFTSGLSQEIRPAKTAKLNNNNNNNNTITTTTTTTTNSITVVTPSNNNTTATFTSTNNTVDLNNAVNSQQQQQQQQYLQQQQNLQQLLQAQKIQTPNYVSTNSTTTPTLTTLISNTSTNQSNNNSASLDQASKQTTTGGGLSTLKSVQSMDTTIMEELLLKQSQSYYIQNTNSASNARVSLTQAPILMQLSRQSSQTQTNSSQHSLSRQNSTQQQQQQQQQSVATKQLQPQPTQKNLNSHYLSSGVASTNSISTNDLKVSTSQQNTPKPAIQQQQQQQQQQSTAMDTVLKNKPSYSLQQEATNYSKPIIVSTSQPPPQQHQTQSQPIHPPSQSVPPILPNQSQLQLQQQQSKPNENHLNQQTSSMYDRSSTIKKAILNDKAKSFSEYKAYLDYLKNGTGTGLGVNTIKTFESQIEAAKALNTNQFPNLTIIRPYNPNEANLIRSNNTANTTPNSNIINTNNINNNNNNNYNNNFLNTMSMLSINSNTNNTNNNNNNNNNNIMVQALMKPIQYFPQQSQHNSQTFSGVSQHHSQQIQPNRIKFNPQQPFTNIKSNPLIQPSYSSFSFNPNQSFMNNSNSNPNNSNNNTNNNNNRISYFPTMSQRVINKTYHPVQSNNVHPSYYHGHGF